MKAIKFLILVVSTVLVLGGCGNSNDDAAVKKAASDALNAMQHGDVISREEVFTSDSFLALLDGYPGFIDFEINDAIDDSEVMENTYTVYATIKYSEQRSASHIILMQEVDGNWKLAAMTTAEEYKKMQNE